MLFISVLFSRGKGLKMPNDDANLDAESFEDANLAAILDRAAGRWGSRTAVVCGGRSFTYAEFAGRTGRLARCLKAEGVVGGSTLAMIHRNCHLVLEAYYAAAALGALFVPLNVRLSDREIASILADCEAPVLIAEARFLEVTLRAVELLAPDRRPRVIAAGGTADANLEELLEAALETDPLRPTGGGNDPAQLYYTSGSTGTPKGVILTHRNVAAHARAAANELELSSADVWLHAAPLFHLADAWAAWAVTLTGGHHVLMPEFDAAAAFDSIARNGVTITNLIPTMLNRLVHHEGADRAALSSMRRILSGGAPMALELLKKIEALFPCEYVQTYGLTETSPYLTLSLLTERLRALPAEEQQRYRATTGRPMRGVEVRVVDEEGRDVPRDGRTVGEIVARGPTVTPGYFRRPGETAAAFRDGWFHTGDLAHVEKEGYLTIVDRIKDVINTGGEIVYSTEVENALFAHPEVREAAVVAVPDDRWGEAIHAVVALEPGAGADGGALTAFCRERLAGFKVPRGIEFVAELPKTGSGKIDKKSLREPYWRGRDKRIQ